MRLSDEVGSGRLGTWYRYRDEVSGRLTGDNLPVDIAANAESLGVTVLRADSIEGFRVALEQAKSVSGPVMVHVQTDPLVPAPSSESWWDVPVAQVAELDITIAARINYVTHKADQRPLI